MTCRELRSRFEDGLPAGSAIGEEAEHLAQCSECTRFVEARRELEAGLSVLRESVPQASESSDVAVLENYRHQMALYRPGAISIPSYRALAMVCGGLAAMLLLAGIFVLRQGRKTDAFVTPPQPAPTQPAPMVSAVTQSMAPTKTASAPASHRAIRADSATKGNSSHSPAGAISSTLPAPQTPTLPEFQSLMYCDELSCGGAMQVIRVQLPRSSAMVAPATGSLGGSVYADVLVGSDGIARGIRIEE
jgi:hypothetical protein